MLTLQDLMQKPGTRSRVTVIKEPTSGRLLSGLAKAACIAMVFGCGLYYIKGDLESGDIACEYEDLSFILEPT